MAEFDIQANNLGRTVLPKPEGQTVSAVNYAVFQSVATMKTYLLAHGYVAADLAKMTFNDLVFACQTDMGIIA